MEERQKRQESFWLPADDRTRLINALLLPRSVLVDEGKRGHTVKNMVLVAVLRQLNDRGQGDVWCIASAARIADEIKCSEKTVRRALAALESLGLIESAPGRHANHYRIDWRAIRARTKYAGHPEVALLTSSPQGPTVSVSLSPGSDCRQSHSDLGDSHSDLGDSHSDLGDVTRTLGSTYHGVMNGMNETPCMEIQKDAGTGASAGRVGWTLARGTTSADLRDPERLQALWLRAVQLRKLPDTDYWREAFFGLAHSLVRRPEQIRSPVGMLHRKLDDGEAAVLKQVTDPDRDWARQAIRKLDGLDMPRVADLSRSTGSTPQPCQLNLDHLEREVGPVLDRLDVGTLAALAERAGPFVAYAIRHGRTRQSKALRGLLLSQLAKEQQLTESS